MPKVNYKEASKSDWQGSFNTDWPGIEYINMASLQRIADATEMMAKNNADLQRSYDYMKSDRDGLRERYRALERKYYALKGVITKLRNKTK